MTARDRYDGDGVSAAAAFEVLTSFRTPNNGKALMAITATPAVYRSAVFLAF